MIFNKKTQIFKQILQFECYDILSLSVSAWRVQGREEKEREGGANLSEILRRNVLKGGMGWDGR